MARLEPVSENSFLNCDLINGSHSRGGYKMWWKIDSLKLSTELFHIKPSIYIGRSECRPNCLHCDRSKKKTRNPYLPGKALIMIRILNFNSIIIFHWSIQHKRNLDGHLIYLNKKWMKKTLQMLFVCKTQLQCRKVTWMHHIGKWSAMTPIYSFAFWLSYMYRN